MNKFANVKSGCRCILRRVVFAVAVAVAALCPESANAQQRSDLSAWVSDIVACYGSNLDSVWTNMPPLSPDVDVRDVMKSMRRRFARQLDGIEASKESVLLERSAGKIHEECFDDVDGVSYRFAAWCAARIRCALFLSAQGFDAVADPTSRDALDFVLRELVCGGGSEVKGFQRPVSFDELTVKGLFSGKTYSSPFDSGWFFFVDDKPGANWSHPCRYVFVSADLTAYATLFSNEPEAVFAGAERVRLDNLTETQSESDDKSLARARSAVLAASNASFSNSLDFGKGNAERTYAVIISGGGEPSQNYSRYWGDVAMIYSTLRNQYAVPKENMTVCLSSGINSDADMFVEGSGAYMDSPLDLDGDGVCDVTCSAAKSQIESAFSRLASTLTSDDQLFVFVTDHGTQDPATGECYLVPWLGSLSLSYGNMISVSEFSAYLRDMECPVALALEFCFSGAFIDGIVSQPNRVIATACNVEYSSAFVLMASEDAEYCTYVDGAYDYCNPWAWAFNSAIRGADSLWGWSPWRSDSNSQVGNADANGDGMVSIYEAAQKANAYVRDTYVEITDESCGIYNERRTFCDAPRYAESSSGLGDKMFVLSQSEATAPVIPAAPSPALSGGITTSSTLEWSAVGGAKYYRVYRSEGPYAEPQPYSSWISSTSCQIVSPSTRSTVYYYWVKAASAANEQSASGFSGSVRKSYDNKYDVIVTDSSSSANRTLSYTGLMFYGRTIDFSSLLGSSAATCSLVIKGSAYYLPCRYVGPTSYLTMGDTAAVKYSWTENSSTSQRHAYFTVDNSSTSLSDNLKFSSGFYNDHHFFQSGQPNLAIGNSTQSAESDAGAYTVDVVCTPATTAWTASVDKDWVKLYKTSSKGSGTLGYIVSANEGSARTATITFRMGGVSCGTLTIRQAGTALTYGATLYKNDGTGDSRSYSGLSSSWTLPKVASLSWSRSGHVFLGWSTSSSASSASYADGAALSLSGPLSLYAVWGSSGPENDNFSDATVITGASGTVYGDTTGATLESGDPLVHYMSYATNTIWWAWTAPADGTVTFSTTKTKPFADGSRDTVMGVYVGSSLSSLDKVAADDDSGDDRTSFCSAEVKSGTTYYIVVSGYADHQGVVTLDWNLEGKVVTYTVTFGKNGGTGGSDAVTATYGKAMPSITIPTKSGYTFGGYWTTVNTGGVKYYNADGTSAREWDKTGDVTLWAKWTAVPTTTSYKVTFGKNGGTGGDNYVTATYGKAMPTPRTAPKKSGYVFDGYWNTTKAGGKQYYDANMKSVRSWDQKSNTTLWAKWIKSGVVSKVTLMKNGGTGGDNYVTATSGKAMPTPRTAPKLSGWTFAGYWDTTAVDANGNPKGRQYYDANMKSVNLWDKTSPATLYAKWTVKVTLGKNGGTGGDSSVTVTRGQSFPKRTMPTKSGYTFGGYFVSSSKKTGSATTQTALAPRR